MYTGGDYWGLTMRHEERWKQLRDQTTRRMDAGALRVLIPEMEDVLLKKNECAGSVQNRVPALKTKSAKSGAK